MKLVQHIVWRLVVPLTFGILIVGGVSVFFLVSQAPKWNDEVESNIANIAVQGFKSRAGTVASYVSVALQQYVISTQILTAYIENILNLPGITANGDTIDNLVTTNITYNDYFQSSINGQTWQPLDPSQYNLFSGWYQNSITTADQVVKQQTNDRTTLFDNAFRAIRGDPSTNRSSVIQAVQMGFDNTGFFRIYPAKRPLTSTSDYRNNNACQAQGVVGIPATLAGSYGYDPHCRQWWITALNTANKTSHSSGTAPVGISRPYITTTSNALVISTGQAFYNADGSLNGAASIQINVSDLNGRLTGQAILSNGYLLMVDSDGIIVSYPNNASVFLTPTPLSLVEPISLNLIQQAASTNTPMLYTKGESQWRLSAVSINPSPSSQYYIVAVVPEADINSLADIMRTTSKNVAIIALVSTVVCTAVAAVVTMLVAKREVQRVLAPVDEMMEWLDRVKKSDLEVELGDKVAVSLEIGVVHQNFKHLLTAVRFGNEAYYDNNLGKALANYEAAENMMIEFQNLRGQGVCLNNKGNVFQQWDGREQEAERAYRMSIEIAQTLLQQETDLNAKRAISITLANRMNNLAVLHKDLGALADAGSNGNTGSNNSASKAVEAKSLLPMTQYQKTAMDLFNKSLTLHRSIDNAQGIAEVMGNLGQLYLAVNDFDAASENILDSYEIVLTKNDSIAVQYACFNMGLLADALEKPNEAIAWYLYVLQRFDKVVQFLQRSCAMELVRLCKDPRVNRPGLAKSIQDVASPLFGNLAQGATGTSAKDMHFVLDVSGSMSGSYIRACRISIKTIINENCATNVDKVALTTFNSYIKQIFPLTLKTNESLSTMLHHVDYSTDTSGGTAFYDATLKAATEMSKISSEPRRSRWVIALTDGEDNSSNPLAIRNTICLLKSNESIGLIVITVGHLRNDAEILSLINACGKGKGLIIRADENSEAIKEAFGKAVRVIQGNLRVENL